MIFGDGDEVTRCTLANGMHVVCVNVDDPFTSVLFQVNVGAGDETEDEIGVAHLVEHMVFKGTANRTARQINEEIDERGGSINAGTGFSSTVFYCTILKEYAETALDVLTDIVFRNIVPEDEFALEKSVVLEELAMYHDKGEWRVTELFAGEVLRDYPSLWSCGGRVETVSKLTRNDVVSFIDRYYVPGNVTVYMVGDWSPKRLTSFLERELSDLRFESALPRRWPAVLPLKLNVTDVEDVMDICQAHVVYGRVIGTKLDTRTLILLDMLTHVLGGGLGSRLGRIREEYGYCYTINMSNVTLPDVVMLEVYAGTSIQNLPHLKELVENTLFDFLEDGLTEREFAGAVNTVKADTFGSFQTTSGIVNTLSYRDSMGVTEDLAEVIAIIDEITIAELRTFAEWALGDPTDWSWAMVTPKGGDER